MSYVIVTDSCSNLSNQMIDKLNLQIVPLIYIVEGKEKLSYSKDSESNLKEYYGLIREKKNISTSCSTRENFSSVFDQILEAGHDIIYIGFTSSLSATYSNAVQYVTELKAKYPKRRVYCADSLCASLGQGLLVTSAAQLKEKGASFDEVVDFIENNKLKICHLFTVETLSYLYKGGRVKKSSFIIAGTLNIKPILHLSKAGELQAISKVFGRKNSLSAMAAKIAETIKNPEEQTIFISHGDCIEDVEFLISKLKEKITFKDVYVNYIDLVIGAHSGPGTVAVFYYGDER